MDGENEYRDALKLGLRRAGIHWLRAGYEVVAGWGAFLDEVAQARRDESSEDKDDQGDTGPVHIELD